MLELHVPETTVQTGMVPVSWCVGPETLAALAERGIAEPHVLIVVAPERYSSRREIRKIVPLKDLMTYVEFRSPGPNRVFAAVFIVGEKRLKNVFLTRDHGDWATSALCSEGGEFRRSYNSDELTPIAVAEPLQVEVPGECFAKAPWDAGWVNLMLPGRPENQCDFRRRRLFAYTVQPVIALGVWLFRLIVAAILLLLGRRGVDLRPLYRPLANDTEDLWSGVYGSFVVPRDGGPLRYAGLALTPAFVLVAVGIGLAMGSSLGHALFWMVLVIVAAVAVILMLIGGLMGIEVWTERRAREVYDIRTISEDEVPWYLQDAERRELLCAAGRGPRAGVGDLPRRRRTLRLRFEGLKAKVCRPFAS